MRTPLFASALLAASIVSLQARDIVEVTSVSRLTPGGAPTGSINIGDDSIPDLIERIINAEGEFAQYNTAPVVEAQLRALGVANAIQLDINAGGPTVTARIRSIAGLDRTFSGPTRADVEDQIDEFLKNEGAGELAKLLAYLNAASPLSVISGNPNSSAAITAQTTFDQYGFGEGRTNAEMEEGLDPTYEIAFRGDVGLIEANGYKARSYSLPISFSIVERQRWALRAQIPLNYTDVEGATIYRAGMNLALPIMVIGSTPEHKSQWYWQVTPSGGTQVTASEDLLAGGMLNNASLTSALEYNFGKAFHNISVSMGNQFTVIESMELTIADYSFDPKLSSQIMKNGLKVSVPFFNRWLFDAYFIDTRFFGDDSYSDGYETVGVAVGFRRKKGAYFKVGSYAHFAKDFTSANFHAGAGWKF